VPGGLDDPPQDTLVVDYGEAVPDTVRGTFVDEDRLEQRFLVDTDNPGRQGFIFAPFLQGQEFL